MGDAARRGLAALLLVGLVASFVARAHGHYPATLGLDPDTDEILALAARARAGEGWLAPGHTVMPTAVQLGPLWHDLVAVATWLGGDDLRAAWRWLVALDVVGVLAATVVLARGLGGPAALAFAAVVLSDPLYAAEQAMPFWYQPHLVAFTAPAAAACVALATGAGASALVAVAVLVGLAAQLHAMAWTLLPVALVATWLGRRRLTAADVAIGGLAFVVAAWPMVRQAPELLRPGAWSSMVTLGADPAVHGDPGTQARRLLLAVPARLTGGLVLAPLALVVTLVRGRTSAPDRALAALVVAWLLAGAAVFAAVGHRWYVHYDLVLLLPLALAVASAAGALETRQPALAGAVVVALAARPLLPFDWGFRPVAPIAWERADVHAGARDALCAQGAAFAAPDDLTALHGFPCAWDRMCTALTLTHEVARCRGADVHAVGAACAGKGPAVDVGFRVRDGAPELWCRRVSAPGALDGPWAAVVLLGRGEVAAPGWEVQSVELPGDRVVRLLTAPVVGAPPPLPALPDGVRQVDAFATDARWTLHDLGVTPP